MAGLGIDVSTLLSVFDSRRRMLQLAPTPSIVDTDSAGVYQVDISFPTSQVRGTYEMNISFGGQQMVTPLADVLACSNSFAQERGMLEAAGTNYIGRIDYTIGTERQSF